MACGVLDYFRDQPELVTLEQDSGNINQRTGHNVQRAPINPVPKKVEVRLDGGGSKVHLHENEPAFYVSLTGGDDTAGADALSVATNDAKATGAVSSPKSQYVIVEVDPRRDYRVITNVTLGQVGHQSENVTETTTTVMPGGHWMKVVPKQKLTVGQYALMELLSPREAEYFGVGLRSGSAVRGQSEYDNADRTLACQSLVATPSRVEFFTRYMRWSARSRSAAALSASSG